MPGKLITIEGIDGCGKSSVTAKLAELLCGVAIKTPAEDLAEERRAVEAHGDRHDRLRFYTRALLHQKQQILGELERGHVVCDRYIHSTIAYQWDPSQELPQDLRHYAPNILWPDYSFLLLAKDPIRAERIAHREREQGFTNAADHRHDTIRLAEIRFLSMRGLVHIEASHLSVEEVCRKIFEAIQEK